MRNIHFFQRLAPTIGKRLCDESLSLAETDVSDADFENVEMLFHFEEEKKVYSLLKESIAPSFQMSLFGLSYDKPSAESFSFFSFSFLSSLSDVAAYSRILESKLIS